MIDNFNISGNRHFQSLKFIWGVVRTVKNYQEVNFLKLAFSHGYPHHVKIREDSLALLKKHQISLRLQ